MCVFPSGAPILSPVQRCTSQMNQKLKNCPGGVNECVGLVIVWIISLMCDAPPALNSGCRKRVKGQSNLFVSCLRAKSHFRENKTKQKNVALVTNRDMPQDHTSCGGLLFGWKVSLFCCPVSPCLELLWDQKPDTKQEFPGCFFHIQDTYTIWELVWTHASLQSVYILAEVCADWVWVWWCDTVAVGACGATPGSVSLIL